MTKKFARVNIEKELKESTAINMNGREITTSYWAVAYSVSYYGKELHSGSVYLGDGFNISVTQRAFKKAFDEAEKWAIDNGFNGAKLSK